MSISYLMDENLSPLYKRQLLKNKPDLRVFAVGDPGAPSISRRYWSMAFCFVICWFCVMTWNKALSAGASI